MTTSDARRPISESRWAAAVLLGIVVSVVAYVVVILTLRIGTVAGFAIGMALGAAVAGRVAHVEGARQWLTIGIVTAVASFVTTIVLVVLLLSWAFRASP